MKGTYVLRKSYRLMGGGEDGDCVRRDPGLLLRPPCAVVVTARRSLASAERIARSCCSVGCFGGCFGGCFEDCFEGCFEGYFEGCFFFGGMVDGQKIQ